MISLVMKGDNVWTWPSPVNKGTSTRHAQVILNGLTNKKNPILSEIALN